MRPLNVRAEMLTATERVKNYALVKALAVEFMVADRRRNLTPLLNAPPTVGHGADIGVEAKDRIVCSDEQGRRL